MRDLELLTEYKEEVGKLDIRIYYKITEEGRNTVQAYRDNVLLQKLFGSVEDLFKANTLDKC